MPSPNQIYCKTPRWRTKATEVPVLLILLSLDVFNFKYCFMFGFSIFFHKIGKLLPWIKKDIFDYRDQEQLVPNINSLKIILWLFFKLDLNIKDNFEKRLLKIKYVCICKLLKITLLWMYWWCWLHWGLSKTVWSYICFCFMLYKYK